MSFGKYVRTGERGYNLERMLNAKFGVDASKDALPKRLIAELQDPNDPNSKVPLEKMKKIYYRARGWNKNGIPTKWTLRLLKLGDYHG